MGRPPTTVDVNDFRRRWAAGEGVVSMGDRYGVSKATVSSIAQRLGLPRRRATASQVQARDDLPYDRRYDLHPDIPLAGGRWTPAAGGVQRWQADG